MSRIETFAEIVRGDIEHAKLQNAKLMKEHVVTDKAIKDAARELGRKHKVDPKFLEFWSVYDFGWEGIVDLVFNITDPGHKNFRSSVHYKWLPMERRGA